MTVLGQKLVIKKTPTNVDNSNFRLGSPPCTPQLDFFFGKIWSLNSISFFQALWEPFNEALDLGNCLLTVDN